MALLLIPSCLAHCTKQSKSQATSHKSLLVAFTFAMIKNLLFAAALTVAVPLEQELFGRSFDFGSKVDHVAAGSPEGNGFHSGYFYLFWLDGQGSVAYNNIANGSYNSNWNTVGNRVGGAGRDGILVETRQSSTTAPTTSTRPSASTSRRSWGGLPSTSPRVPASASVSAARSPRAPTLMPGQTAA